MTETHRTNRREFLRQTAGIAAAGAAGVLWPAGRCGAADEKPQNRWQIGCFTRPWAQYEYRVALDAIAEAGFKHAGLMTTKAAKGNLVISIATTLDDARAIGEEIKKRGLSVPSVYGGGFPVGESVEAGIAGLRKLIDNCEAVGAASLMAGGTGPKDYDRYYKVIAECCDYAAEKKIGIALKPHGGLNATGPQCRKAIEMVGHKNFGLWYDPGNIFFYSEGKLNPVDDAATVGGVVTGMCIKDYRAPKDVALTPGTGQVDFPKVLAALEKGGFTGGPLVVETLAPGDRDATVQEAVKARKFVESLVASR
jgi:sugar phosphate isomerase/epimerase